MDCVACFPRRFSACDDCLPFTVVIATFSYTAIYDPLQDFQRNGDDTGTLFEIVSQKKFSQSRPGTVAP